MTGIGHTGMTGIESDNDSGCERCAGSPSHGSESKTVKKMQEIFKNYIPMW